MEEPIVKDSLWVYASGLVNGDIKLKDNIMKNPKVAFSLIGQANKKFGSLPVPVMKQMLAYIFGYLNVPYNEIEEIIK